MIRAMIRISVLLAAFSGAAAWAQTSLGRILGTVRDPSQSAVPGVLVVVTNDGTGWRRDFLSQEDGGYEVTNLVPGTYTISAELAGFKRFVRPSVVLESGRTVRIDVALEVGELRDEMRVDPPAGGRERDPFDCKRHRLGGPDEVRSQPAEPAVGGAHNGPDLRVGR
jgi:hypothetical protein